jgi:hypothetical protein
MQKTSSGPDRPKSTTTLKRERATRAILAACAHRFPAPDFNVRSDEKGTVWVTRSDTRRSVGLEPWLLRDNSTEDVLARVAVKLGV